MRIIEFYYMKNDIKKNVFFLYSTMAINSILIKRFTEID